MCAYAPLRCQSQSTFIATRHKAVCLQVQPRMAAFLVAKHPELAWSLTLTSSARRKMASSRLYKLDLGRRPLKFLHSHTCGNLIWSLQQIDTTSWL